MNKGDCLYVLIGYVDLNQNGDYDGVLQGVFSTGELACKCGDELIKRGVIHHYDVENPRLDECGYE